MRNLKRCQTHNHIYKKQPKNLLLVHFVCMVRQSLRYLFQNNIKRSIMKSGVLKSNTSCVLYNSSNRQSMVKDCSKSPLTKQHYFLLIKNFFFFEITVKVSFLMLFISPKKLFQFLRYSNFCISVLCSFSHCRPLHQRIIKDKP